MNTCGNIKICNNNVKKINNNFSSCHCEDCVNICNNFSEFRNNCNHYNDGNRTTLNPKAYIEKRANDFSKQNNCYISNDPRLNKYGVNTHKLSLDNPPQTSYNMKIDVNIDDTLNNYGKNYTDYSDINAGNIIYYINHDEIPNNLPKIHQNSKDIKNLYVDPMGGISLNICKKNNIYSCEKRDKNCLSYIQDSNNHRNELMHNIANSLGIGGHNRHTRK